MEEIEILTSLKNQLKVVSPELTDESFSPLDMINEHPDKAPFYLKNILDNLYNAQLHNKIDFRANAIKSSAAMIFNTLGSTDFFLDGRKYNNIKYEVELEVIKIEEHKHNAHLDASFISDNGKEINFVEAKMLEWLSSPKNLSRVYLDKKCYLKETGDKIKNFIDFF